MLHGLAGVLWVSLGLMHLILNRTVFTAGGLRPAGRLRPLRWQDITSVYVTSRPDRGEQVALVTQDKSPPAWIHDPERLVLQRWEAETGERAASYGAGGPPRSH